MGLFGIFALLLSSLAEASANETSEPADRDATIFAVQCGGQTSAYAYYAWDAQTLARIPLDAGFRTLTADQILETINRRLANYNHGLASSLNEFRKINFNEDYDSPSPRVWWAGDLSPYNGDLGVRKECAEPRKIVKAVVRELSSRRLIYRYDSTVFAELQKDQLQYSFTLLDVWLHGFASNPEMIAMVDHILHSESWPEPARFSTDLERMGFSVPKFDRRILTPEGSYVDSSPKNKIIQNAVISRDPFTGEVYLSGRIAAHVGRLKKEVTCKSRRGDLWPDFRTCYMYKHLTIPEVTVEKQGLLGDWKMVAYRPPQYPERKHKGEKGTDGYSVQIRLHDVSDQTDEKKKGCIFMSVGYSSSTSGDWDDFTDTSVQELCPSGS
ncbi:MAG: hypothetical protein C5B49_14585 [Bdellovibrio sp.]|nr:MAG: hypothetical protein C5B49_14585 [Bdellovibrio sp.]